MHTRTVFGIVASLAYLGGVLWLRWPFTLDTLRKVPINELGDTLAGLVGPIALLWLVIGYFQQGEELRQNGRALHLQAEELKNAVEQHKEMVKATREQLHLNERALHLEQSQALAGSRPQFEFVSCGLVRLGPDQRRRLMLQLARGKAYYPQITTDLQTQLIGAQLGEILSNGDLIYVDWAADFFPSEDVRFTVEYRDENSYLHRQILTLRPNGPKRWEYRGTTFDV